MIARILLLGFLAQLGAGCEKNGQAEQNPESLTDSERIVSEYRELSHRVRESGRAEDQFAAFTFANENARILEDFMPEAVQFLVDAANSGHADAQYNLGYLVESGRWLEKNEEYALDLYERAARQGQPNAELRVGLARFRSYFSETDGQLKSRLLAEAECWLRKTIDSDRLLPSSSTVVDAKGWLGQVLLVRAPDDAEGLKLLQEAAIAGNQTAIESLNDFYVITKEEAQASDADARVIRTYNELARFVKDNPALFSDQSAVGEK